MIVLAALSRGCDRFCSRRNEDPFLARLDSGIGALSFFIALYKGYYKAEGLNSSWIAARARWIVQQMASGVYDMGYPDISVVED